MRLLSPILSRVLYPSLARAGAFRNHRVPCLTAITYHGVLHAEYRVTDAYLDAALVSPEAFLKHLRLLKLNYDVIAPEQFLNWLSKQEQLPRRAVLLTCDDGLLNNLTQMTPVLRQEGLSCLFFVTGASAAEDRSVLWYIELYLILMRSTLRAISFASQGIRVDYAISSGLLRRALWLRLMKELSQLAESVRQRFLDDLSGYLGLDPGWRSSFLQDSVLRERFAVMQKSDLLELAAAGMSIGAHSLSHPVLSEQSSEMIETEIAGSRDRLAFLPKPVWAFAYPFGEESSAGEREFRCTREAGFRCAFMNVGGSVRPGASPFSLPRVHVTAQMSLGEFEARVCGFDSFLRKSLSLR